MMTYSFSDIPDTPRAVSPLLQHAIDTYAGETNKTAAVWRLFTEDDFAWKPHPRSASVLEIMKHQLLSERRFFSEFLGTGEPPATEVLPAYITVASLTRRFAELASARLPQLASMTEAEWLQTTAFFDVDREKIWIFWRRILHGAHHRTQLTVYLRLLDRPVPAVYGPTADTTWAGADPTTSVEAASRSGKL